MRVRPTSVLVILTLSLCCNAAAPGSKESSFKGRIAAYRPADRIGQVASSVLNRELLLFHVDGTGETLLKLVYLHQGYSDLKDNVLSGAQGISISARRDPSCDQDLGTFEKEALAITIEGDKGASTERVVFSSQSSLPAKSYRIKCYVLERWTPLNAKHK